jgi:hypothetical protein
MFKKDPIFWSASAIFVAALVLYGVTQMQFCLALMVGAYLLRPTLASLGIGRRKIDERQMTINYRSGNIAFAVTIMLCIVCMARLEMIEVKTEDNV